MNLNSAFDDPYEKIVQIDCFYLKKKFIVLNRVNVLAVFITRDEVNEILKNILSL